MKAVVLYQSKYGYTTQYAAWLAAALGCEMREMKAANAQSLAACDTIIVGSGIYAGQIAAAKWLAKNAAALGAAQNLVLFTVGLTATGDETRREAARQTLGSALQGRVRVFHLLGGVNESRLGFLHKGVIGMMRKMLRDKPPAQRSEVDEKLLEMRDGKCELLSEEALQPLLDCVRGL